MTLLDGMEAIGWWFLLVPLAWLACGFTASGFIFATLQSLYPHPDLVKVDRRVALIIGLVGGPTALLALLLDGDFKHGWRLR